MTPNEFYLALREPAPLAGVVCTRPLPWAGLAAAGYAHYVSVARHPAGMDVAPLRVLGGHSFQDLRGRSAPDHPGVEEAAFRVVVESITCALRRGEGVVVHSSDGTDRTTTVLACTLRGLGHSVMLTLDYMGRLNVSRAACAGWRRWPESPWQAALVERWPLEKEESLLREAGRYLAKGRHPGAFKAFRSLIELAPHRPEGYLGLARVLEANGRYGEIVDRLGPVDDALEAPEITAILAKARHALAEDEDGPVTRGREAIPVTAVPHALGRSAAADEVGDEPTAFIGATVVFLVGPGPVHLLNAAGSGRLVQFGALSGDVLRGRVVEFARSRATTRAFEVPWAEIGALPDLLHRVVTRQMDVRRVADTSESWVHMSIEVQWNERRSRIDLALMSSGFEGPDAELLDRVVKAIGALAGVESPLWSVGLA